MSTTPLWEDAASSQRSGAGALVNSGPLGLPACGQSSAGAGGCPVRVLWENPVKGPVEESSEGSCEGPCGGLGDGPQRGPPLFTGH